MLSLRVAACTRSRSEDQAELKQFDHATQASGDNFESKPDKTGK